MTDPTNDKEPIAEEPQIQNADRTGLIDHVLAVTLIATFAGAFGFGVVGTLMGALGVGICKKWGETAGLIGGSAAVGLFVGAIPRLVLGRNRNVVAALAWFVVVGVAAFIIVQYLPTHEDWRMLRWAVVSVGFSVIICGLSDPVRWLRTMGPEEEGPWIIVRVRQVCGAIVTCIATGRIGATLAGAVGGILGSAVVGIFLAEAGEDQFLKFIDNTWMVVVGCMALGLIAGAINGWLTWPRVTNFDQLERYQMPEVE